MQEAKSYGGKEMSTTLTLEQHEFIVLKQMIEERFASLKDTIEKSKDVISEHEQDIKNYTTYDLYTKVKNVIIC